VIETQQAATAVDEHADGVETDRAGGRSMLTLTAQPRERQSSQPPALTRAQRRQRLLVGPDVAGAGGACLDLGEDDRAGSPVEGDHVDLAFACAHVARERREAQMGEVRDREVLAEAPECAPRIAAALAVRRICGL